MIDAHLHLGRLKEPKLLLTQAKACGLSSFVTSSTTLDDLSINLDLAKSFNGFCSLGLHPCFIKNLEDFSYFAQKIAAHPNLRAIRECGFDKKSPLDFTLQQELVKKHLELASKLNLPVSFHLTSHGQDAVSLVKLYKVRGMVHWAQGSVETIKAYLRADLYLSFCTSSKITATMEEIFYITPKERILVESDFDEIKAQRMAYDVNSLYALVEKIAKIKGLSAKTLEDQISENFFNLYGGK